jgi:hypothetical protein
MSTGGDVMEFAASDDVPREGERGMATEVTQWSSHLADHAFRHETPDLQHRSKLAGVQTRASNMIPLDSEATVPFCPALAAGASQESRGKVQAISTARNAKESAVSGKPASAGN